VKMSNVKATPKTLRPGLRQKSGIQSVERAFGVLNAFKSAGAALRLVEIVDATGMPASLARAYLISLERVGAIQQDPQTQRYDLSETVLQLGLSALSRTDFLETARSSMQTLRDRTGETVWLSVWSDGGPITVAKIDGIRPSAFEVRIGALIDLMVTATGQVFLAYSDPAIWKPLVKAERKRLGISAPDDQTLSARLATVRKQGMAARPEVVLPKQILRQFSSIAAPVFSGAGNIRAVLTIIGQSKSLDPSLNGTAAKALATATKQLSLRLGYASQKAA
jgi:DNA-binding IclR family transcriptional regulator